MAIPEDVSPQRAASDIDESTAVPRAGLAYIEALHPYDPQQRLDSVRSQLAFSLIGLLALVVVGSFALVATQPWTGLSLSEVRLLIELIGTPIVALVSAATGFYFGANIGSSSRRNRRP